MALCEASRVTKSADIQGVEKCFRRIGTTAGETGDQARNDCRPSLTAIGLYARRF